jgi:hypothetical protein
MISTSSTRWDEINNRRTQEFLASFSQPYTTYSCSTSDAVADHTHGTHNEMSSVRALHSGRKARIFNLVELTRQPPLFFAF